MLFPSGMEMGYEGITPSTNRCRRDLDLIEAASILIKLSEMLFVKRSNAQLLIAQVLGLCWLCLTTARTSHPANIKSIHEFTLSDLCLVNTAQPRSSDEYPTLILPTSRGNFSLLVSQPLLQYLIGLAALNPDSRLFDSSLRALRTSFNSILKTFPKSLHSTTFQSFLSFDYTEIYLHERYLSHLPKTYDLKTIPRATTT